MFKPAALLLLLACASAVTAQGPLGLGLGQGLGSRFLGRVACNRAPAPPTSITVSRRSEGPPTALAAPCLVRHTDPAPRGRAPGALPLQALSLSRLSLSTPRSASLKPARSARPAFPPAQARGEDGAIQLSWAPADACATSYKATIIRTDISNASAITF